MVSKPGPATGYRPKSLEIVPAMVGLTASWRRSFGLACILRHRYLCGSGFLQQHCATAELYFHDKKDLSLENRNAESYLEIAQWQ